MKFLHAADIHLDGRGRGLKDFYGEKSFSVAQATQQAFVRLIDLAISESVDFILFPGDVFDSNWKDYSLGLFFIEQIKRVSCPIYYIRGNHDAENKLLKKLPYPAHFFEFSSVAPQSYVNKDLRVALHGQSYAMYRTRKDLSEAYPDPVPGFFNIGLLHTSGDIRQGISPYAPYKTALLKEKGYDYWALGHLHDFQIVQTDPHLVYSGNIQGRHIRERGPKGCCIVEVSEFNTSVNFHPLTAVYWDLIQVEMSGLHSEEELKKKTISQVYDLLSRGPDEVELILRIELKGLISVNCFNEDGADYLNHLFYLWLDEEFGGRVRLEKVENKTEATFPKESLKKESLLFEELLGDLDMSFQEQGTKEYFKSLVTQLREKAPSDYKRSPLFMDLEELTEYDKLIQHIREKIHRHLMEEK